MTARRELGALLAVLGGGDKYGVPPLFAYRRFSSAGTDLHGQCAVGQGARGVSASLGGDLNLLELLAPGMSFGPLKAGVSIKLKAARLATSVIVLYRLAAFSSIGFNGVARPIAVGQLDGKSWRGNVKVEVNASADLKPFAHLDVGYSVGGAKISAGVQIGVEHTTLNDLQPEHFARHNDGKLARHMDSLLEVELRKACVQVVKASREWDRKDLIEIVTEQGGTAMSVAAAATTGKVQTDIKKAKGIVIDKKVGLAGVPGEPGGWVKVLTGAAAVTAQLRLKSMSKSIEQKIDVMLNGTDEQLLESLKTLTIVLEAREKLLPAEIAAETDTDKLRSLQDEKNELEDAIPAIKSWRMALDDKLRGNARLFLHDDPVKKRAARRVLEGELDAGNAATLRLSSFEYELSGNIGGNLKIGPLGKASASASAGVAGRMISFRYQMPGHKQWRDSKPKTAMLQQTTMNFLLFSANAALEAKAALTGSKKMDDKVEGYLQGKSGVPGLSKKKQKSTQSAGFRRFGALTYQAATIYYDTETGLVHPNVSGLSFGVSIRVSRLCQYADMLNKLQSETANKIASDPEYQHWGKFENWVCRQLHCTEERLRSFVRSAPLGSDYDPALMAEKDRKVGQHAMGYPVDALLLESAHRRTHVGNLAVDPTKLPDKIFDHLGYKGLQDKVEPTVLRLRYRVSSPLGALSTQAPQLGLFEHMNEYPPKSGKKTKMFGAGLQFGLETEVGHEAIVDVHAWINRKIKRSLDRIDKHELVPPAVVLFNRR